MVTFDYAHQIMYLKPLRPRPADVGTFDRSGLWINAETGGYEVTDVSAAGAAAAAGLAVGDHIVSVDGKASGGFTLSDLRMRLRDEAAGTVVTLQVRHGSQTRSVRISLRDQI